MNPVPVGKFMVVDPRVCHGKLTFKGTRLPVESVLYSLSKGRTLESILEDWPYLRREAVLEAIKLAAAALEVRYTREGRGDGTDHRRRAIGRKRSARTASAAV